MSTASLPTRRRTRPRHLGLALAVLAAVVLATVLVDRLVLGASSTSSTTTGSGVAAAQPRPVARFTGVELAGANNVVIRAGGKRSVVVHADRNLLGRVTTQVHAGRLVIGTTPGELAAKTPMFVTVTVPSLRSLTLSGAGNIVASGISGRALAVALGGSGTIHATGAVRRLDVAISGQGTAQLRQLVARDARATLSGDGSIVLTATQRLAAKVSGTGSIVYLGRPPDVTWDVTGTGDVVEG